MGILPEDYSVTYQVPEEVLNSPIWEVSAFPTYSTLSTVNNLFIYLIIKSFLIQKLNLNYETNFSVKKNILIIREKTGRQPCFRTRLSSRKWAIWDSKSEICYITIRVWKLSNIFKFIILCFLHIIIKKSLHSSHNL